MQVLLNALHLLPPYFSLTTPITFSFISVHIFSSFFNSQPPTYVAPPTVVIFLHFYRSSFSSYFPLDTDFLPLISISYTNCSFLLPRPSTFSPSSHFIPTCHLPVCSTYTQPSLISTRFLDHPLFSSPTCLFTHPITPVHLSFFHSLYLPISLTQSLSYLPTYLRTFFLLLQLLLFSSYLWPFLPSSSCPLLRIFLTLPPQTFFSQSCQLSILRVSLLPLPFIFIFSPSSHSYF